MKEEELTKRRLIENPGRGTWNDCMVTKSVAGREHMED